MLTAIVPLAWSVENKEPLIRDLLTTYRKYRLPEGDLVEK